ncbi:MAG: molybdenum cofactor biosynthesis protein MoaE [Porticoccaceae bacterium]|nr:molybdenum cofactor biosynthesis protein MoaE [Porticoccaceae bacterium]
MHTICRIQNDAFDVVKLHDALCENSKNTGAVATFTGLVRGFDKSGEHPAIDYMYLQHYPQMTESSLKLIIEQVNSRFDLLAATVIHRIGKLKPGDPIVFVGIASEHRRDGFQATQFIMDYIKTQAAIWKQVSLNDQKYWVEVNKTDLLALKYWQ